MLIMNYTSVFIAVILGLLLFDHSDACRRRSSRRRSSRRRTYIPSACSEVMNTIHWSVQCTDGYAHGSTCTLQCRGRGYSACSGSRSSWTCNDGNWNSEILPSCCDTTAPSLSCPTPMTRHAGRRAVSIIVSWSSPQVTDNSGENIQPRRTSGRSPGSLFGEGTYTVWYEARDSANNRGTCSFTVTVIVRKCNTLTPANHQMMSCSHNFIYGSTCSFSCSTGWCIDGTSSISCEIRGANVYWNGDRPICKAVQCSSLSPPANGHRIGLCSNTCGSRCRFGCNSGFEIVGDSLRQCMAQSGGFSLCNGFWSGHHPVCRVIDTDPPDYPNGPQRVVVCAEERSFQAQVDYNWEPVKAIDAVSGEIIARLVSIDSVPYPTTESRPSAFLQGVHRLVYEAVDEAGISNSLEMELVVDVIRCDIIYAAGNIGISCSHSDILGSTCTFSCPSGQCVVGASSVICENLSNCTHPIGRWSEGQPSCQLVQCPELSPPSNGHFVNGGCTTNYGDDCQISCNSGFSLKGGHTHRLCQASIGSGCNDGYWSGQHPLCEDSDPPVFPPLEPISLLAVIRQTVAFLSYSWEPVIAIDTVSGAVEANLISIDTNPIVSDFKPTTLNEGLHILEYEAEDEAGNKASETMQLAVEVSRCHIFEPGSYESISCSHQNLYGSTCTVTCPAGECIMGSKAVFCDNTFSVSQPRGEWNDTSPNCQPVHCPEFTPPTNGFMVKGSCPSTSYGSTCDVMCNPGYIMFETGEYPPPIECVALEGASCNGGYWRGSVICVDLEPPIFDIPSPVKTFVAEPGNTHVSVDYNWEPITAFDTASGQIVANLISIDSQSLEEGANPDVFTEGIHTLVYEAKDDSGNKATSSIQLRIVVVRCSSPEPIENGQIYCDSEDHILGNYCYLACNVGYCYEGISTMTCLKRGESSVGAWSVANPLCLPPQCPDLLPPARGYIVSGLSRCSTSQGLRCEMACDVGYRAVGDAVRICRIQSGSSCDDAVTWSGQPLQCDVVTCPSLVEEFPAFHTGCNNAPGTDTFGSSCQWHCPPGYRSIGSDVSTCLLDGTWDYANFGCEDTESPRFTECPESRTVYASRNRLRAYVGWTVIAVDNSGEEPTVSCNMEEGTKPEGVYNVNCSAIDKAGNGAICIADVIVTVRRCQLPVPVLPSHGNVDTQYPCDNHYGGDCWIMCDEDYELQGSSQASCEYDAGLDQTVWTWSEQPVCESAARCTPDLDHLLASDVLVNCTNMNNMGSICSFYCSRQGYIIAGVESPLLCQTDGTWNVNVSLLQLRCEAVQCNPLLDQMLMFDVLISCTDMNNVGSTCTFHCLDRSYAITGVDSSLICEADGSWNVDVTLLQPRCEDILPPVIDPCPSEAVYGELSPDTLQAEVHFVIPQASDNSHQALRVETTPTDIMSPYNFTEDTLVTYRFIDEAGNNATCSFQVIIQNNLPPNTVYCPQALEFDSPYTVVWQIPQFSNPVTGEAIVPIICNRQPDDDLQPGVHTITCRATNPDNNISSECEFLITVGNSLPCNRLPTPVNGRWHCIENSCSLECDSGYALPLNHDRHFTCGNNGWLPTEPTLITCKRTTLPAQMLQTSDAFFSTDVDCTGEEMQRRISEEFNNFLGILSSSIGEPCSGMCNVRDTGTTCQEAGALSRRKRRESTGFWITVCFTLEVDVSGTATEDEINNDRDAITSLANNIATEIGEGHFIPYNVDMIIEPRPVDGSPMKSGEVTPICDAGMTQVPLTLTCLPCEADTYEERGECYPCPPGEHQPLEGQTSCESLSD